MHPDLDFLLEDATDDVNTLLQKPTVGGKRRRRRKKRRRAGGALRGRRGGR
jgi:hypothetical protein